MASLEFRNITHRFGDFVVVDYVSLTSKLGRKSCATSTATGAACCRASGPGSN